MKRRHFVSFVLASRALAACGKKPRLPLLAQGTGQDKTGTKKVLRFQKCIIAAGSAAGKQQGTDHGYQQSSQFQPIQNARFRSCTSEFRKGASQ